ncbi:hypothetical protein KP509_26G049500 [Ceratopteris richardii]|uniref:Uncharacterized protein n=1 Tax=Ceratopteris richardii TaxID=49495 RepID=A0A8T2RM42_CERRI|nr:hypothetical protein KP509_26G049500 [Ceratopteris richardii]
MHTLQSASRSLSLSLCGGCPFEKHSAACLPERILQELFGCFSGICAVRCVLVPQNAKSYETES